MKRILLVISVLSCLAFGFSNASGLKFIILNKLKEYSTKNYPEKIYIQTDKPYYTAGENIWFNTYLVNGVTHIKSEKSKIIYVELVNEQDSIISERKLFTDSISVKGDFKLPIDLKEGNYLLRAYTNYMRNQANDFFFKKEIPVFAYNSEEPEVNNNDAEAIKNSELPDIGFYPEGGYLINGINNKVAVKIKDADLAANSIVGIIEDTDGKKVSDFKTFEFGLGFFYLQPEPDKKYHAVISSNDEDILYPLPVPLGEGYVMNTSITDKEILIKVETNEKKGLKNILLIGQQRGLPAFDYIHDKNTNTVLVRVPTIDLIEGVLDIVLFNELEQPVAERLVYIKKENTISVSVKKTNGLSTGLRERVDLAIAVKDKSGKLIPSTLSLSVTDAELIKPNTNAENIKTYLLLNSDLRGKIKSPNYFFTPGDSIKKNELLDLTMLTHGWRRFTWQELIQSSSYQKYIPEDGIYISGHTIDSKTPFRSKFSETKLTFRKNGFLQETQNTEKNGYFNYGPYVFKDEVDVLLQAGEGLTSEHPNFSDTDIKLSSSKERPSVISERALIPFKQETITTEAYQEKTKKIVVTNFEFDKDRELLEEVNITAIRDRQEELANIERRKRTHFALRPSHRIIVDEMGMHGGGEFMELIANVPGIRIGKKYGAQNSQDLAITLRGLTPDYYLDGIKVDLPLMRSVHQADIDFIDVRNVGHASANFPLAAGGVIAMYSKQGTRNGISKNTKRLSGSISFKLDGFYNSREFYAPNYSHEDRNSIREDNRTTLFWDPKVIVKEDRNATVTFYTSDDKGRFQVEVEGITDTGTPIHTTAILEVE